jgi:hypothetical protein
LPISEWRMRTGFCCARRARRARFDERVAPPTNEKSNPVGLLRSLGRVDKKDALLKRILNRFGKLPTDKFQLVLL